MVGLVWEIKAPELALAFFIESEMAIDFLIPKIIVRLKQKRQPYEWLFHPKMENSSKNKKIYFSSSRQFPTCKEVLQEETSEWLGIHTKGEIHDPYVDACHIDESGILFLPLVVDRNCPWSGYRHAVHRMVYGSHLPHPVRVSSTRAGKENRPEGHVL